MEDKNKKRMLEIMNSLEESHEVYKETEKITDNGKLLKEGQRLKDLASGKINSHFKENYYIAGKFGTGGRGQTVNSFIDTTMTSQTLKSPKSQPSNLKPEEALEICIKRVLKSGSPINNIGFYDEINWNLMNLGFPAVNEIDIKNSIFAMLNE